MERLSLSGLIQHLSFQRLAVFKLTLAGRAEVSGAPGQFYALNFPFAAAAGLVFATIDKGFVLVISVYTFGAGVVSERGAAELDGIFDDFFYFYT